MKQFWVAVGSVKVLYGEKPKGAIIFSEREGRLSVIAGGQFFLVPPLACVENLVPPFDHLKKFCLPHKQTAPLLVKMIAS